ncbi:MAG: hypothetical protein IJO28_07905 [Oscillospiraceae bacterium]|nr:hypothetical protein [Oscillospiraceae bacterium]
MKKTLAVLLSLMLIVSAFAGCGNDSKEPNHDQETTNNQTENNAYEYLFRELPEAKYVTAASAFAGGDGSEGNPYQISNAAELALLHEKMVADDKELKDEYKSAHYVLTADIAINDVANFDSWENTAPEYSWMPIGFDAVEFDGVFDGKGYTISGLYINTNCGTADENSTNNYGLFDTVDGTVKNVKIDKSFIAVSGRPCGVGSIAGLLMDQAMIDGCSSTAVLNCYDNVLGGIAGNAYGGVDTGVVDDGEEREVNYSTIANCTFAGKITQVKEDAMTYIGGIIGECDGNVEACVNHGTIAFTGSNVDSVGGIAGRMSEGTVSNCKNTGTLDCEMKDGEQLAIAGGIVGKVFVSATGSEKYMSRGALVTKCENSGSVSGQMYAGGIAGQVSNDHNDYCVTVSECVNSGVVISKDYTAGIIGHLECTGDADNGDSIVVENCENKADLSKGTVGGIIGRFMSETGNVKIKGCKNTGSLASEGQHCAGIVAYWIMNSKPSNSNTVIDNCENTGSIASALNAGGVISFMDMPVCLEMGDGVSVSISNCVNSGNITIDKVNGYIGGILGNWGMANVATVVDNCANSGTLAITAAADNMTEQDAEIMTVSRIAGGIVGRVGSGLFLTTDSDEADEKNIQSDNACLKITNSKNTGNLDVVNIDAENYKNWFGGIIGNTCGEDGFAFFVDKCTYTGFDRGLGNESLTDIGTKN